jgi:hypothetical protein
MIRLAAETAKGGALAPISLEESRPESRSDSGSVSGSRKID